MNVKKNIKDELFTWKLSVTTNILINILFVPLVKHVQIQLRIWKDLIVNREPFQNLLRRLIYYKNYQDMFLKICGSRRQLQYII